MRAKHILFGAALIVMAACSGGGGVPTPVVITRIVAATQAPVTVTAIAVVAVTPLPTVESTPTAAPVPHMAVPTEALLVPDAAQTAIAEQDPPIIDPLP